MARVCLTDKQKEQAVADRLCRDVVRSLEQTFVVEKRMNKRETAFALGLHPNTWSSWRTKNIPGNVGFRDVVTAAEKAGYTFRIERRS